MNSDIPLEMAAICFLANRYLKQGIHLVYIMIDFICMGLLDLWGARNEYYKMKNSYPQWDSNPVLSGYETNLLSVALLDQISIEHLDIGRVFPEFNLWHVVDVAKWSCIFDI